MKRDTQNHTSLRRTLPKMSTTLSWVSAAFALTMAACGSSSTDGVAPSTDSGVMGLPEVGKIVDGPGSCTAPHSLCVSVKIPDSMTAPPALMQFDIYDAPTPPAHPPNAYAGVLNHPKLTAGQTIHFELTDADMQGDFWLFTIVYMPGGGYGAPIVGVDYLQHSAPASLHFDGTADNIADPVIVGL